MEGAKLSKKELTNLIFYGLKENNIDIKSINSYQIQIVINHYLEFCYHFQRNYVVGELDTFKRAACLLVAINIGTLSDDKWINASIALDAAYKMCERPYLNVGENFNIPKKLEEVDFKRVFENDMDIYTTSKNMLIDSLVYEKTSPMNYHLNLELLYQIAIRIKYRQSNTEKIDEKATKELISSQSEEKKESRVKSLNLFKKH